MRDQIQNEKPQVETRQCNIVESNCFSRMANDVSCHDVGKIFKEGFLVKKVRPILRNYLYKQFCEIFVTCNI